jgi:hypothetical protein
LEITSEGIARILRDRVFRNHGLPKRIIHDRDTRFISKYSKELFSLLGITQNPSTAYHPQTDGQTERMNQSIEQYLRLFVNHRQDNWKEWLPLVEFSYNNSIHSATKETPFFLNYGQHPWTGKEASRTPRVPAAGQFAHQMKSIHEEAAAALRQSADKAKRSHDAHARPSTEYKPGSKVYLEATNITTTRPMKKLDDKRHGPFEIIEKVGASAYKLKLPNSWSAVHPVFNESLLTLFREPQFHSQQKPSPPPPEIIEGQEEYEVEEILDSRRKGRWKKLEYLVHWKGYGKEEDTWEPANMIDNSMELVKKFHEKNPNRPGPTNHIRAISTISQDPRLFNEYTGELGIGFKKPITPVPIEAMITLTPREIICLIQTKRLPSHFSPSLFQFKRLWIYETEGTDQITFVTRLHNGKPLRLYQFTDPVTKHELTRKKIRAGQAFRVPQWLNRDSQYRLMKIW